MKKHLQILIIAIFFITGCKSKYDDPEPDYGYSTSYLPLETGNTWTYVHNDNIKDTVTTTVNGNNFWQGYQLFYGVANSESDGSYYSQNNSAYYMMIYPGSGSPFASPILDTYYSDGYTITTKDSLAYSTDPTPTLSMMTILQNDFSMKVNGKTYDHVIHTNVDVQEAFNGSYMSIQTYDFYFVMGIGLIEIDKSNAGYIYDSLTLLSYKVN